MNYRQRLAFAILLFAILGLLKGGYDIFNDILRREEASVLTLNEQNPENPPEFTLYFFEGNTPCSECDRIRSMTKDIFQDPAGKIALFSIKEINVETPGNERYVLDLGLYSTSVVLAMESGGKIIRWKNLEKVWDLTGNEKGFREYMIREIELFAGGDR